MPEDLSYPVGRFDRHAAFAPGDRPAAIRTFVEFPAQLRQAVAGLDASRLDTAYRPGGWTVRQLVHHVADSHMNGYVRLKLALTEDAPTIKAYDQDAWATLPDSSLPVGVSLGIIDGVHQRWTTLWQAVTDHQFARTFVHPELGPLTIETHLHLYAWHARHHLAHVTGLRTRMGW